MVSELLFNKVDIFSVLENQKKLLRDKIRSAPKEWMAEDQERLHNRLTDEFSIEVPVLRESDIEMSRSEVDIDVKHDPLRYIIDRSQPFYLKGSRVTFHVPFSGDGGLFDVQPTSFTLNPPRGSVMGSELQLVYDVLDDRMSGVKGTMEGELAKINTYLGNLRPSAVQLRTELNSIAKAEWQSRKQQFIDRDSAFSSLTFPVRKPQVSLPSSESRVSRSASSRSTAPARTQEWDIFISHASEDKDHVARPLAQALEKLNLRVWFDETTLTLGDSLRQRIDEGLARSRFGVVILSRSFFSKHWPQRELNGLAARESHGTKIILPVWHEIDHALVASFSPMLADKLAVDTSVGINEVAKQISKAT